MYVKLAGFKVISPIRRFLIIILFIILISFLLGDIPNFLTKDSDYVLKNFSYFMKDILIFNLSILLFGSSIILFCIHVVKVKLSIFGLKLPSFRDSRKGFIKIGKIDKNFFRSYNFFLSIEDLEKHMFICGSTGTGKSNFLQYFLLNFTKQYKIPFFPS